MMSDYQFQDVNESVASEAPGIQTSGAAQGGFRDLGGDQGFAQEIFSRKINARFRTFYVDLKESGNGKFLKISEKSHGRKNTIMMDAEDIPSLMEALGEVQKMI